MEGKRTRGQPLAPFAPAAMAAPSGAPWGSTEVSNALLCRVPYIPVGPRLSSQLINLFCPQLGPQEWPPGPKDTQEQAQQHAHPTIFEAGDDPMTQDSPVLSLLSGHSSTPFGPEVLQMPLK